MLKLSMLKSSRFARPYIILLLNCAAISLTWHSPSKYICQKGSPDHIRDIRVVTRIRPYLQQQDSHAGLVDHLSLTLPLPLPLALVDSSSLLPLTVHEPERISVTFADKSSEKCSTRSFEFDKVFDTHSDQGNE